MLLVNCLLALRDKTKDVSHHTLISNKVFISHEDVSFTGYSRTLYGGHKSLVTNSPKPGYNGEFGYRRNIPALRSQPSSFDYEGIF